MAAKRRSTRNASESITRSANQTKKTKICKAGKANKEDLASDSEMRMLFDLEMQSETNVLPVSFFEAVNSDNTNLDDLMTTTEVPFHDKSIGLMIQDSEINPSFKIFNASLSSFSINGDEESSPESIFSETFSDSVSPELSCDKTMSAFSRIDTSSILSSSVSGHNHSDENVMETSNTIDLYSDNISTNDLVPQIIYPEKIPGIDPSLTEIEDVDAKFASLESYNSSAISKEHEENSSVSEFGPQTETLRLAMPQPAPTNEKYESPILAQSPFSYYNWNLMTPNASYSDTPIYGNVIQQVAGAQCTCNNCKSMPFNMGNPIAGTLGKKREVSSTFRLLSCTPKDFEKTKKLDLNNRGRYLLKRFTTTEIDQEPGVVRIIKPGDKQMRISKRLGFKSDYHTSTYSFKPPSEYMMKTWSIQKHDKNESGSQINEFPDLYTNTQENSLLPCLAELASMDPVERWQNFKHRYTKVDQSLIQSTKECRHCCRLFVDIESYMKHLQKHGVIHQNFCLDKDCPLAVIGFPRKTFLRRHICNDHLDQYSPYLSTHKEEILNHNLTRKMFESIYVCDKEDCHLPFYRLDAKNRHLKLDHKPKKFVQKRRLKLKLPKTTNALKR